MACTVIMQGKTQHACTEKCMDIHFSKKGYDISLSGVKDWLQQQAGQLCISGAVITLHISHLCYGI